MGPRTGMKISTVHTDFRDHRSGCCHRDASVAIETTIASHPNMIVSTSMELRAPPPNEEDLIRDLGVRIERDAARSRMRSVELNRRHAVCAWGFYRIWAGSGSRGLGAVGCSEGSGDGGSSRGGSRSRSVRRVGAGLCKRWTQEVGGVAGGTSKAGIRRSGFAVLKSCPGGARSRSRSERVDAWCASCLAHRRGRA